MPVEVDRHDRAGALRNRTPHKCRIDIQCIRLDIDEHRPRPEVLDNVHCGAKRHWSGDHFMARADCLTPQAQRAWHLSPNLRPVRRMHR